MLTRKKLLAGAGLKKRVIETEAGPLHIRELTGSERMEYMREMLKVSDTEMALSGELQLRLLRWCVLDESGAPMFTAEDDELIAGFGGALIETAILGILELSGMTDESVDDAKKNSKTIPSELPGTDSQKLSVAQ